MSKQSFYSRVWRWHFYAGLLVIPFMLVLAVTGSIYLFKPQLDPLVYPQLLTVSKNTPEVLPMAPSNLVAAAKARYPSAQVESYFPAENPQRSVGIGMVENEIHFTAYANPYSGEILGALNNDDHYQNVVKKIHGELLIGRTGDTLVELASCWGLLLVLTGLYLWWPRQQKFWGVFLPRLKNGSGHRVFWRDLHAVIGVYSSLFICVLILTGLPWTGFWGERYAKPWNQFPPHAFSSTPQSEVKTGVLNKGTEQMVPWAAETAPLPESSGHHAASAPHQSPHSNQISLDQVLNRVSERKVTGLVKVAYPANPQGVFTLSSFGGNPRDEVVLHIDQYSGAIIEEVNYSHYNLFAKAVGVGISLHQGQLFGWPNQLLALFTCLAIIALSLSGAIMWWKRRPTGSWGVPPRAQVKAPWWVLALMVLFGVLFPLVGASLIVAFIIDKVGFSSPAP